MKTYIELEQLGIIGTYAHEGQLRIITKGGHLWVYFPALKVFEYSKRL